MKRITLSVLFIVIAFTYCTKKVATTPVVQHDNLVSAANLSAELKTNKNLVVIDVRPEAKYLLGHVPNSRQVWRPDIQLSEQEVGYDGMRVTPEGLAKIFGDLGINHDTDIVIYGDNGNLDASRLYWLANMYGHQNLRMLSGGWKAWVDSGLDSQMGVMPTDFVTTTYNVNPSEMQSPEDNISFEEIKKIVLDNNSEYIIVDTRSEGEYSGKQLKKGAFLKGRIPNVVWLEWTEVLDENQHYKSVDELKDLFASKGITPDKKVIVYCQSGVRSAHTFVVLKELLGYENVQNYDGSWIEWSYQAQSGNAPIIAGI